MRKKSDEEYGILITREMITMMFDASLSHEARTKMFCAIVGDEPTGDVMMDAFAASLKSGYEAINKKRKDSIDLRRGRQKKYQDNLRASTPIDADRRSSTDIDADRRSSTETGTHLRSSTDINAHLRYIVKYSKVDNIPLNPPSGVEGKIPDAISPDDLLGRTEGDDGATDEETETTTEGATDGTGEESVKEAALALAERIEATEAFGHMRVNRGKLMKCLVSILKKNGAAGAEVEKGIAAWTEEWKADGWAYAPGRITDWLYDGKYLEEPREKKREPSVGAGCGECGVTIA